MSKHRANPSPRRTPRSSAWRAALALACAGVLATGGLTTWSSLFEATTVNAGTLGAGSVALAAPTAEVQLLSKQPTGSRTYSSTTTCTPPSGYQECQVVTASLSSERLVPGDTLRIRQAFNLTGAGDNLKGTLSLNTTDAFRPGATAFGTGCVVTTSVIRPDATVIAGTSAAVDQRAGFGFGTWTLQLDIVTPTTNSGADWGQAGLGVTLDLHQLSGEFTQST